MDVSSGTDQDFDAVPVLTEEQLHQKGTLVHSIYCELLHRMAAFFWLRKRSLNRKWNVLTDPLQVPDWQLLSPLFSHLVQMIVFQKPDIAFLLQNLFVRNLFGARKTDILKIENLF